jgi:Holliday junction resolvase RusA-like endonuclease
MVEITVYGIPGPQGSKSFRGMSKKGHAILTESSKQVKPWREAVVWAARDVMNGKPPLSGPILARMVFTVKKPKSAPKRRRTWPSTKPDLSKYARSTEDALTNAGVYEDDGRIIEYSRLAKVFPGEDPESLDVPGVRITILVVTESE